MRAEAVAWLDEHEWDLGITLKAPIRQLRSKQQHPLYIILFIHCQLANIIELTYTALAEQI